MQCIGFCQGNSFQNIIVYELNLNTKLFLYSFLSNIFLFIYIFILPSYFPPKHGIQNATLLFCIFSK